jgi:PAS domain S-box-containing protein
MESTPDLVSARTLQRERTARKEAESLLEQKSRELYEKNQFLQESELRYRNLVELAPDAIWIHCEGRITFLNQAALRLFGATCPEQLLGTLAVDRVPEQFRPLVEAWTPMELDKVHQRQRSELRLLRLDGKPVDVEFFGCSIRFNNRDSVMHAAHDVTERLQQVAIRHRATHDELTGLANRAFFLERLGEEIEKARRAGTSLAVAFVDLDKFKQVNDTRGHAVGDELLRIVAAVLRSCVRDSDTVARLGGDEFVLMLDSSQGHLTPAMLGNASANGWRSRSRCPASSTSSAAALASASTLTMAWTRKNCCATRTSPCTTAKASHAAMCSSSRRTCSAASTRG